MVIAEDVEGEALTSLVVNKKRGIFNTLAIRAPSFGDRRETVLQDIAIMTGGQVISEKAGRTLDTVLIEELGYARSVTTKRDMTVVLDGNGKPFRIAYATCTHNLLKLALITIAKSYSKGSQVYQEALESSKLVP